MLHSAPSGGSIQESNHGFPVRRTQLSVDRRRFRGSTYINRSESLRAKPVSDVISVDDLITIFFARIRKIKSKS
jgi:hypothetical protein